MNSELTYEQTQLLFPAIGGLVIFGVPIVVFLFLLCKGQSRNLERGASLVFGLSLVALVAGGVVALMAGGFDLEADPVEIIDARPGEAWGELQAEWRRYRQQQHAQRYERY